MSDVFVRVSGACGRITLTRPRALNALTSEMVGTMYAALIQWANDPSVQLVVLDGEGERGLCAGGDIRAMYMAVISGTRELAEEFFRGEYRLNYLISRYPKPYVALMDGIVMGGGIGVSAHASHRVVTERTELAMPETAIGFVPDVGGTHLLGTAPDEFGTYLGLSGSRIGAADAIHSRLADRMVLSRDIPALTQDLERCDDSDAAEDCLRGFSSEAWPSKPSKQRAWIGECFAPNTVEEIFAALAQHPDAEAHLALKELQQKSPTSLKVTLTALRNGRRMKDLASCLQQEYSIAKVCLRGHDFVEGVRAAIIDKDRTPRWAPAQLEEVSTEEVQRYFAESTTGELELALPCE